MSDYRLRPATLDDAPRITAHRIAMFEDMGLTFDAAVLRERFAPWVRDMMAREIYKGWMVEDASAAVIAGGGFTIIPWPPGPRYLGDRLAFVYNVYTEPAHRRRGLAGRLMRAMQDWCRREGITSLALNASVEGQPLYESLGYTVTASPMMFLALD
jgi:GNAT superfamily N-acetyltransferase